jgi:hypothetical protein
LYRFLQQRGGTASSVVIVAHILKIRNAQPSAAERLVRGLVGDDPLFVADGLGNWYLDPRRSLVETPLSEIPIVLVEGKRSGTYKEGVVEIAFVGIEEGRAERESVFHLLSRKEKWKVEDWFVETTVEGLRFWMERIQDGVWLAFRPARLRSLLSDLSQRILGSPLEGVELSLHRLGKRLDPSQAFPDLERLASAYGVGEMTADTPLSAARLAAEVWLAIEEKLRARGIHTLEQAVIFQDKGPVSMDFSRFGFGSDFIHGLPESPGVYLMRDQAGRVIYVGKARNLARRVGSYFLRQWQPDPKVQKLMTQLHSIEIHRTGNELDALLKEHQLIRRYQPEINRQMEIHARGKLPPRVGDLAFLLPAYHQSRVALFFLSEDGRFQRISLRPAQTSIEELKERIDAFFFAPNRLRRKTMGSEWEIALRWFLEHQDQLSSCTMDAFSDSRQAAVVILRLASDPEVRHQRLLHILQESDEEEDYHD